MQDAREVINQLMLAYGDRLLRLCALYLRDASLAQDAVQETFLRAFRSYGKYRGEAAAQTWLTSIAVNVCRDMLRSPWMRHTDRRADPANLPEQAVPFVFPDSTVITEVMRLPVKYREAVLLRYYQGLKQAEIADALHLSVRAVRARLNKANALLRDRLKEWYEDEA